MAVDVAVTAMDAMSEPSNGDPFPTVPFYVQVVLCEEGTLDAEGNALDSAASMEHFVAGTGSLMD